MFKKITFTEFIKRPLGEKLDDIESDINKDENTLSIENDKYSKYTIKKNNKKWTIKNDETGKVFYLKISYKNEQESLVDFLKSVGAKTGDMEEITDLELYKKVLTQEPCEIYIPKENESKIKDTYSHVKNSVNEEFPFHSEYPTYIRENEDNDILLNMAKNLSDVTLKKCLMVFLNESQKREMENIEKK